MENTKISPHARFARRFWPLFMLGLTGVASLPLTLLPALRAAQAMPPEMPPALLAVLMLIQPLLLLLAATALGAGLAHRVGLHALLTSEATPTRLALLRRCVPLAAGLGLLFAVVTVLLDQAMQPWLSPQWKAAAAESASLPWSALLGGVLYGGITEEILLRWGLMSLFAWAGWRLFGRGNALPSPAAMWGAIALAALLFGLGHLPAAAAVAPLDAPLVVRTVLLNALGGMVFGWLFWRCHLEAAMLAHASTHVGFALLRAGGLM